MIFFFVNTSTNGIYNGTVQLDPVLCNKLPLTHSGDQFKYLGMHSPGYGDVAEVPMFA